MNSNAWWRARLVTVRPRRKAVLPCTRRKGIVPNAQKLQRLLIFHQRLLASAAGHEQHISFGVSRRVVSGVSIRPLASRTGVKPFHLSRDVLHVSHFPIATARKQPYPFYEGVFRCALEYYLSRRIPTMRTAFRRFLDRFRWKSNT